VDLTIARLAESATVRFTYAKPVDKRESSGQLALRNKQEGGRRQCGFDPEVAFDHVELNHEAKFDIYETGLPARRVGWHHGNGVAVDGEVEPAGFDL
jgi:hypothetical protein